MSFQQCRLIAAFALLLSGGAGALLWHGTRSVESGRPAAEPRAPAQSPGAVAGERAGAAQGARGLDLTPQRVAAIDPDRDPQQWVEAVDAFRTRIDHFAHDASLGRAQRGEEGEDLLRLVDAFATKSFYLPGQRSQVKLEIARRMFAYDPEVLAERSRQYESDELREMHDFAIHQSQESLDDARFQSFKAQEAALIDQMVRDLPPGPERDAAIASGVTELHRRIYGGPEGRAAR